MSRIILHADMNNYFASVECLHNPSLRGKPMAVCGNVEMRHGIVLSKSYEAKAAGVKTAETIWEAKQKCPDLIIVPPHYEQYVRFAHLIRDVYKEYTDYTEPFSIDESWLDISHICKTFEDGRQVADEIRKRIKFEFGLTVSIGVSFNKVFAKLGSDLKKPDAVSVISKDNFKSVVWPLPTRNLLYVGKATEKKLREFSVRTIGDLAQVDIKHLRSLLGKTGDLLQCFANGTESSPVARFDESSCLKSVGNSTTVPRDLKTPQDISIITRLLCETIGERLRKLGMVAEAVQVNIRDNELYSFVRQVPLSRPTSTSDDLHAAAFDLILKNWNGYRPLRSLGVRAFKLLPDSTCIQTSIFEDQNKIEKRMTIERTVDDLRRRFGKSCIVRAVTALDPTLHSIDPKEDREIHHIGFGQY